MLIISGPTAVGKTDFAYQIAQHIPAEIINMDVGQFYTPLSVGTAKPDWQSSAIPHHLFDILNTPSIFSVVKYRVLLLDRLHAIWKRGNVPILVGGSGFYLKSILFPPRAESDSPNDNTQSMPKTPLWEELNSIDPDRAAHINKNDTYRIKRALDIWHSTGKRPSLYVPEYTIPAPFLVLFLTRDRKDLYKRINERVIQMVKQEWFAEVERLYGTAWEPFIKKKKIIGYNEIIDYLAGDTSEQALRQTISTIQKRTRNYAKRQETFWRMLERLICSMHEDIGSKDTQAAAVTESINLTSNDHHLYIKQLINRLDYLFA